MPTGTFEYRSQAELTAIQRAIDFVAETHDLALSAPEGRVLDQCERQVTDGGRDLLRDTLQGAVQARIDAAEQKKGLRGGAAAADRSMSSDGASGD
jgi:hypothetical protein